MMKDIWKAMLSDLLKIIFLLSMSWMVSAQEPAPLIQDILDLHFSQSEIDSMRPNLSSFTEDYRAIRQIKLPNEVAPVIYFNPLPTGFAPDVTEEPNEWPLPTEVSLPNISLDLAFFSVHDLSALIRARKITSESLTKFFISRLKTYGDTLKCIITITDSLALSQARQADQEINAGVYRGPLHGIPYGLKDLFAVPGYPTSWGARPYQYQVIDQEATVVRKLREAGAVLVGKLSMGALAWGDVWFGGTTRNPWDLTQGSSGSSSGSASAVAAGLIPFALGSETWGSIVSPATRCGVTGLRPTFGRVSRTGAMTLSWSMDKVGPICRSAEDCAMVLDVIRGADGIDKTSMEAAFSYPIDAKKLKVAYFANLIEKSPFSQADLSVINSLQKLGIHPQPISFDINLPIEHLDLILNVEAAAAFDELTRTNRDDELVRQIKQAWPNVLRAARMVTAVEYIQANRVRKLLVEEMHSLLSEYDVIITPTFAGDQLLATNLTGQPVVVVPSAYHEGKPSASICFLGNLFEESKILALAQMYQDQQPWSVSAPPLFSR